MRRPGGSDGNVQLPAIVATILLVGLALEGATLLDLTRFLTLHAFVGMRLIPVVARARQRRLANGAVLPGRRRVRSPRAAAPVPAAGRLAGRGRLDDHALRDRRRAARARPGGPIAALHKASFVVWVGSVGLHVLIRLVRLPDALRLRRPGLAFRLAIASSTVVAGFAVATLTLPAADRLQDDVSAHVGLDAG
jgi:hypothetical protein